MKQTITITMALAALLVVAGCGRGGKPIARIYGEQLSQDDIYHVEDSFGTAAEPNVLVRLATGAETSAQLGEPMALQALRRAVLRKITLELARKDGVAPTSANVDAELKFRGKLAAGYLQSLTRTGLTMSRVKEMIEVQLAEENLLTEGVKVTKADAEKFRSDNKQAFMDPATADLLWIYVTSEAKKAVVNKRLLGGDMFNIVADDLSEAPGAKQNQGKYGVRIVRNMPAALQKVVTDTPANQASAVWLPADKGFAKFFVVKKEDAKPMTWEPPDERTEDLRRSLAKERGRMGKDLNQRILNELLKAKDSIDIQDSTLKAMWKDWLDRVQAASEAANKPETSPATGSALKP